MKKKSAITFKEVAEKFVISEKRRTEMEESARQLKEERGRKTREKVKRRIDKLLETAGGNIRRLIAGLSGKEDREFTSYLLRLLVERGQHFTDNIGVCGFRKPALRWTKIKATVSPPGIAGGLTSRSLVGCSARDYDLQVRVLVLHQEKQCHEQSSSQVIALTALQPNVLSASTSIESLRNCKLVLLQQTIDKRIGGVSYKAPASIPFNGGFEETLRALAKAKTTFEFFLKRFGFPFRC